MLTYSGFAKAPFFMKKIIFLGLFALCWGSLTAQNSPVLEAYIREGMSRNLALQQRELDLRKSLEGVRLARALFRPTLQFNANYTLAAGGRRIDFPIGDLLNPVYGTLNQLTQSNSFPMLENQRIQFLPNNFQETKIKFAYPIFNTDLKFNRQIQELLVEGQAAQKAAYEQELRHEITLAYLQYLQALEAEKIYQSVRLTLTELRRFNESLVKNNVATRDVVATADYQLSQNEQDVFATQQQQVMARAYFNFLINKDLQAEVVADSTVLLMALPDYDLAQLIEQANTQRRELAALQAGRSAAATAVDLQAANRRFPDFYLGGEAGFQGFGYRPVGEGQAYVLAQVGLTYDLYDGGQNSIKTQTARVEAEKITLQSEQMRQQIALQITQAHTELAIARHAVLTARSGLQAAEETLRITRNKYRAGQALLLEYTDATNRVTTARLQLSLAEMSVQTKHATLRRAAGF
jgi:outer membrane protein